MASQDRPTARLRRVLTCGAIAATALLAHDPAAAAADDAPGSTGAAGVEVIEVEGESSGDTLRFEIEEPAQMAILTGLGDHAHLEVRSRNDGIWSEWIEFEAGVDRPDDIAGGEGSAESDPGAVGPIWLGDDADRLEVRHRDDDGGAADEAITVELLDVGTSSTRTAVLGSANASSASFIAPRSSWATSEMGWQSDTAGCGSKPSINSEIKAMVVHHTAGTSSYSRADVPGIIRGTWYYHARTKGWCDIAYNFVVDRFGGIWEGRQGGIDKLVRGGHTYGHNSETQGVVQLGHFDQASSPAVMNDATGRLVGWKLGRHGVDPKATTVLTNRSSRSTSKGLAPGASTRVPTVSGHRDLGSTSCPGANTYAQMWRIRDRAALAAHTTVAYRTFLDAVPDASAIGPYVALATGRGVAAATDSLVHSDHYAGQVVDDLYRRALGRPADGAGRAYWVSVMRSGARVQDVGTSFYGSEEFFRRSGSPEAFVEALYGHLLHRAAEPSGLAYWARQIRSGAAQPTDVADGFYASIESRRDRVTVVYQRVLGRTPDAAGRDYWAGEIARSGDLSLAMFLAHSEEYYRRNLR